MKILIPVVVGAIIGYFTNWLAIKMLFRPHYQKKFMGVKIPFTPGLIPKERKRIAESIGQAVGKYLLDSDTIIKSLSNQGVDKKIKGWIEGKIGNLKNNHNTIKEVLENAWENYTDIISTIKANIVNLILSQIRKEQFINETLAFLHRKIDRLDTNNIYSIVEKQLEDLIKGLSNSHEFKERLGELVNENIRGLSQDDRTLGEVLPEEIKESLDKYLEENKELIGQSIKRVLKEPSIKIKIRNSISDLITENFNKVFFAFISPDLIAEKIYSAIERHIENDETNDDLIYIIKTFLNRLMEAKISDLVPRAVDSIGEEGLEKIGDRIIKAFSNPKTHNIFLQIIRNRLEAKEGENKEKLLEYLDRNIRLILDSEEMKESLFSFVSTFIDEILDKPISSIIIKIDSKDFEKTYKLVTTIFNKFLEKDLPQIVEFFKIEKIVEDRMNAFEVDFFEEIILEIAERELKAITWLGGILGGLLGLLSPLLQMIY
ncbi:MAG: DUF445 family protein [Tissierellia bacterium]|nr:DUF445 family protein [Tissierellia bacterium]